MVLAEGVSVERKNQSRRGWGNITSAGDVASWREGGKKKIEKKKKVTKKK